MKNLTNTITNEVSLTALILMMLLLCHTAMQAQKEAQFTQYMNNTMSINPAYVGSRGAMNFFGLYRAQWVGIDGAPVAANLSFNSPVGKQTGLGVALISASIGPSEETDFAVDFSYNIPIKKKYRLFLGLKASANLFNVDFTKLNIYNSANPSFENNIDKRLSPNIGTGIYFRSDKFYAGVSVPYFLKTIHFQTASSSIIRNDMSLYLMGGYVFDLSEEVRFKPALLGTFVNNSPIKVDMSANFLINQKFICGLSYGTNKAVSFLSGFQVTKPFYFGYSYNMDTSALSSSNGGMHELFLKYEIFQNTNGKITDRFF